MDFSRGQSQSGARSLGAVSAPRPDRTWASLSESIPRELGNGAPLSSHASIPASQSGTKRYVGGISFKMTFWGICRQLLPADRSPAIPCERQLCHNKPRVIGEPGPASLNCHLPLAILFPSHAPGLWRRDIRRTMSWRSKQARQMPRTGTAR